MFVTHALVIEDNFLIALMIEDALIEHGYDSVDVASSQTEAADLADRRPPDFITVDQKLDGGTGMGAIREICRGRAIPYVVITADPDTVRSSVAGAIVISKPFWGTELGAALDAAAAWPKKQA